MVTIDFISNNSFVPAVLHVVSTVGTDNELWPAAGTMDDIVIIGFKGHGRLGTDVYGGSLIDTVVVKVVLHHVIQPLGSLQEK